MSKIRGVIAAGKAFVLTLVSSPGPDPLVPKQMVQPIEHPFEVHADEAERFTLPVDPDDGEWSEQDSKEVEDENDDTQDDKID